MLFALIAIVCGAQLTAAAANSSTDACYLAVAGTAVQTQSASADCSTFLDTSIQGPPVYVHLQFITGLAHDFSSSTPTADVTATSTQTIVYATSTLTDGATTVIYGISTYTGGPTTVVYESTTIIFGTTTSVVSTSTATYNPQPTVTGIVTNPSYTYNLSGPYPKTQTCDAACIPAYASPCSGTAQYSSACSALGITATTVTIPPVTIDETFSPTVTVTTSVLANSPTSTLPPCANAMPTFAFEAGSSVGPSPNYLLFAGLDFVNGTTAYTGLGSPTLSGATNFSLNAAGNLVEDQFGFVAVANIGDPTSQSSGLYFDSPDYVNQNGYLPLTPPSQ
ncbi:hypothetical protein LPUS_09865 [Lasallia pustulata]|uniref:Uncharacterized protein n=1 Tax=Lasallia pustulata TaxID=136370 RepID=A0A1W5D8M3_9LECA|nr:hypothetical protein LPUS_09865 [Lasallia pustulata]